MGWVNGPHSHFLHPVPKSPPGLPYEAQSSGGMGVGDMKNAVGLP